jgi:ligand-binding sensor protein
MFFSEKNVDFSAMVCYTSHMNRIDLFLDENVKHLIDSFSYCFNVRITIFSADLEEKLAVGFYPTCSYCELVREQLRLKGRCLEQDRKLCLRSLHSASPQFYGCHAGMVDAVIPIKLEEWGDYEVGGGGSWWDTP